MLILASGSPQRKRLMTEAGYKFEVISPNSSAEDDAPDDLTPVDLVAELARRKAIDVAAKFHNSTSAESIWILAADTIAECDGAILGKPSDADHARGMLRSLSGREHRVLSGVCVMRLPSGEPTVDVAVTRLLMDRLPENEIDQYVASGLWEGKAGAFGLQDRLGWVHILAGSESNVIGLPMELVEGMLGAAGYRRNDQ